MIALIITMAQEARQSLEVAHELSKLLDCGLDKESLSICIALLEQGLNPEVIEPIARPLRVARAPHSSLTSS